MGIALVAATGCAGQSSSAPSDDDAPGRGGSAGGSLAKGGSGATSATGGATAAGGSGGTVPREPSSCGLGPADARRVATTNLDHVLKGAIAASAFVEGSSFVGRALALGDRRDPPLFVDDASKKVDELVDWLETKVLAEGNAQSTLGPSILYSVKSEIYCAPNPEDVAADPEWAKEQAADCARDLAENPLSVEVVFDACEGEGAGTVTITPAVGSAHAKPFTVKAAPEWLAVTLDIAETVKYAAEQGSSTAFDGDSYGRSTLTVDVGEPNHAVLDVSLDGPLVVGFTQDEKHSRVETDESPDLFRATADGDARRFTGNLELPAASLTTSFKTFVEAVLQRNVTPAVPPNDTVSVDFAPSRLSIDFGRDLEQLVLSRMSPTADSKLASVRNGDDALISASLNDRSLGTAELELEWDQGGVLRIVADPSFELDLGFLMQGVAEKIQDLQSFAKNDVVSFRLEPETSPTSVPTSAPPSIALLLNDDFDLAVTHRTPGPELLVDWGTFVMSSQALGQSTTVNSGLCLVYDPNSQVEHEILRGYEAAACPSVFK